MRGGDRFKPTRFGPCRLCGKVVYGRANAVRFDGGFRHSVCIPGGDVGQRYHVGRKGKP